METFNFTRLFSYIGRCGKRKPLVLPDCSVTYPKLVLPLLLFVLLLITGVPKCSGWERGRLSSVYNSEVKNVYKGLPWIYNS